MNRYIYTHLLIITYKYYIHINHDILQYVYIDTYKYNNMLPLCVYNRWWKFELVTSMSWCVYKQTISCRDWPWLAMLDVDRTLKETLGSWWFWNFQPERQSRCDGVKHWSFVANSFWYYITTYIIIGLLPANLINRSRFANTLTGYYDLREAHFRATWQWLDGWYPIIPSLYFIIFHFVTEQPSLYFTSKLSSRVCWWLGLYYPILRISIIHEVGMPLIFTNRTENLNTEQLFILQKLQVPSPFISSMGLPSPHSDSVAVLMRCDYLLRSSVSWFFHVLLNCKL